MTTLRRHRALVLVLAGGLMLRMLLAFVVAPGQGFATDMGQFWAWAQALAAAGPGSFYTTVSSANYPPGYLYVLWALGIVGDPALLKLPAILADLGIAAVAYALAARWRGDRAGLVAAALFLFLPVSWYDSALWGQVDAVGTLVVMLALLFLVDGWSEAALVSAALAVLVKPQYAVVLVVVLPVLARRHLLVRGSGPQPRLGRTTGAINRALGGLLRDQGPRRLASSVVLAGLATIVVLLPFDIAVYAPTSLADIPVIANVAGLAGLIGRLGSEFSVLTANAFNPWALVGSPSLAQGTGGGQGSWLADALPVLGGIPAVTVGAVLLATVGLLVAGGLLVRDGIVPILLGFTILALAFFVLPTRVHERYAFPFFATAAVLAAPAILSAVGYALVAILGTVNLHAILAGGGASGVRGGGRGGLGFGSEGGQGAFGGSFMSIALPWSELANSQAAVTAVAVGMAATLVVLLGAWAVVVLRPAPPGGPSSVVNALTRKGPEGVAEPSSVRHLRPG